MLFIIPQNYYTPDLKEEHEYDNAIINFIDSQFFKIITAEKIDENNIKISLLNKNLYLNLSQIYSDISIFSELSEASRKFLTPLTDRITSHLINKALGMSENMCDHSNSTPT